MSPILCFTCGNVLANKVRYFQDQVRKRKISNGLDAEKITYLTKTNTEKTIEGIVLDELKLFNPCCRRHMLTDLHE